MALIFRKCFILVDSEPIPGTLRVSLGTQMGHQWDTMHTRIYTLILGAIQSLQSIYCIGMFLGGQWKLENPEETKKDTLRIAHRQ